MTTDTEEEPEPEEEPETDRKYYKGTKSFRAMYKGALRAHHHRYYIF